MTDWREPFSEIELAGWRAWAKEWQETYAAYERIRDANVMIPMFEFSDHPYTRSQQEALAIQRAFEAQLMRLSANKPRGLIL